MAVTQVRIVGWKPGFKKVTSTELLRKHVGMSLTQAKVGTDRILDNQPVEVSLPDAKAAAAFTKAMTSIGAIVEQI